MSHSNDGLSLMYQKSHATTLLKVVGLLWIMFVSSIAMADNNRFHHKVNKVSFKNVLSQQKGSDHLNNLSVTARNRNLPPRILTGKSSRPKKSRKSKSTYNRKKNNELVPADFANIYIKKQELASMHTVLNACLKLLPREEHAKFEKVFSKQLKILFPQISNPKSAMTYLSNKKDYKRLLKKWKNKYSDKENLTLCNEMVK